MPPNKKFSKQDIITAAFEIAKVEGMDQITIRKVAQKLGSSIAPIYVNFNDVEELKKEVMKKIQDLSNQMLKEQNTGSPFKDIGVASIKFAKQYSFLFRDLIMKNNPHMTYEYHDLDPMIDLMKMDPMLKGLTEAELKEILLKMQIFQAGLSIMVANGLLPKTFSDEDEINMLDSTAHDVINGVHLRKKEKR